MNLTLKWATAITLLSTTSVFFQPSASSNGKSPSISRNPAPKIQAAILLDVSNSMDGLIEQAKAQLWNMVSVMGKAKCNDATPEIEIALYEYGSPRNDVKQGYVKQISGFTRDLDGLSKNLFSLTTNGGDEYCGQVILTAINDLVWDTSSLNYKVIFIAGNEDFLQGSIHYTKACDEAKRKGVIVNTIYCGDKMQGIREHWNLSAECGNGSFTNIDQNVKEEYIPTPYDSSLMVLNTKLNGTYIGYGSRAEAGYSTQAYADVANLSASKPAAMKRISVKGQSSLYRNSNWDMVDASTDDSTFIAKLDKKNLPDSLKNKSKAQLQQLVKLKKEERAKIQQQISTLSVKRDNYLVDERKKRATNNQQTLESETEKLIKTQARRFNMLID